VKQAAKKIVSLPLERSKRSFGTDELNICEFPLTTASRTAQKGNVLVFEDEMTDEGLQQRIKRTVIVSSSEGVGLPTPADSDVLLVLMELTNTRNRFSDSKVQFKRYELVKALGWNQSGKSYQRLDESLQRWVHVTLQYNQAWWVGDENRWHTKSFHILESIDLRGKGDSADDGTSSFTWNQIILDSFKANRTKQLDLDAYFQLKSFTAKQAYRFLDKRFYVRKHLDLNLRIFACEHLGLSRNHDIGQLKRNLQPALEELGFLKPMTVAERYSKLEPDDWRIKLIREGEAVELENAGPQPLPVPLLDELLRRGLHLPKAKEILENHPADFIREKLALLDWLTARKREPKNPAGYLAAAIRDDYKPPADYQRPQPPPITNPPVGFGPKGPLNTCRCGE
jgi:hypothetical protein